MYKEIYETLEKQGTVKTAIILDGPMAGRKCLVTQECCRDFSGGDADWLPFRQEILNTEQTAIRTAGENRIFVEIYRKPPRLVLLGGGHVSCPTAHIGKMLGFHVTVMDDRPEFITRERFPDADERILGRFEELSEKLPPYENTYYVIITRGHAGDAVCAEQILKRPYAYLGMIGSRTKVGITREKLLQKGFPKEKLDTLHAPIGLPIGGQLPEEIAVSILAEIIQVKNRHYTAYCDEKTEKAVLEGRRGVMVTITEKSGSSPRGAGSKMFVEEDGTLYGSIGGGSVEFEAAGHCRQVRGTETRRFNLSLSDERNLGMICGGHVEVLFEKTEP